MMGEEEERWGGRMTARALCIGVVAAAASSCSSSSPLPFPSLLLPTIKVVVHIDAVVVV